MGNCGNRFRGFNFEKRSPKLGLPFFSLKEDDTLLVLDSLATLDTIGDLDSLVIFDILDQVDSFSSYVTFFDR